MKGSEKSCQVLLQPGQFFQEELLDAVGHQSGSQLPPYQRITHMARPVFLLGPEKHSLIPSSVHEFR